jgi:hypothetical protein
MGMKNLASVSLKRVANIFGGDCPGSPNNADLASRGQTCQQATVCPFAFTGGGGLELPVISVKATGNSDSGSIWHVL